MNDAQPHRPYVDPTMVDHDQPARAPAPAPAPAAWEQASHQPRRASSARRQEAAPAVSRRGYFSRHWHGEQSLVRSYWVNNMLVATPLAMALTGLMSWISAKGESLQVSAIVLLLGLPLLTALDVWCIVGAWRAAGAYLRAGGAALWGWAARLTLAAGALQLAISLVFGFLPDLGEYWQMARGIDPIGQATLSLSADGHSLRLDGTIGMGDGERLATLLKTEAARDLRRIELSSPGGRVHEAEKMAEALKQHGHGSRAVGTCASACTLVFLAGNPRQLSPGAQLGFHRASTGTYNPVFEELANQQLAATYRDLGLPQSMIDQTLRTPSQRIWFAPREELMIHALIAPLPQTLAIALPAAGRASLGDFDDALRIHPVWDALEKRQGGTVTAVARQMFEMQRSGAADEQVQAAALPPLARLMPGLIADSDAPTRRRYVQLVTDQLKALRMPEKPGARPACRDLLEGRLGVRQQLPLPLQVRESQWLQEAAGAAPPRWLPKPASPIEVEVLARSVGPAALGLLSQLWANAPALAPGPGAGCDAVIATLDRLPALPPARRELVERLLFQAR